jgi:hypothetical protein
MTRRHLTRDPLPTRMIRLGALLLAGGAAGCWKDEYAEVPIDVLTFQPEVEAPLDWLVAPIETELECPDGQKTRFYLVYPDGGSDAPMPAAVLYHGGAFDFVFAPEANDPLASTHYAEPSRLTTEWAIRQVFATLGMYPDQTKEPSNEGLVATALVERGVAVMVPANCWGDLWANKPGGADNSFVDDFYFRQGRAAAEWSYRFLVDPLFASAFGVELPIQVDPAQTYAIGLQEGGRAVAELLHVDNDGDGVGDFVPAGVVVDSSPDDLTPLFADPALYATTLEGFARIYPEGTERVARGSLATVPVPTRTGYLHAIEDPNWPDSVHDAAAAHVAAAGGWVYASPLPVSGFLNGDGNLDLARDAVDFLLDGTVPAGP